MRCTTAFTLACLIHVGSHLTMNFSRALIQIALTKTPFHSDTESHLRGMHRTLTSPQSKGTLQMRAHTYTQSKTKNCLPDPKLVLLYVQQPGQVRCHHNVLPYIFRKIHTYLDNNISAG